MKPNLNEFLAYKDIKKDAPVNVTVRKDDPDSMLAFIALLPYDPDKDIPS